MDESTCNHPAFYASGQFLPANSPPVQGPSLADLRGAALSCLLVLAAVAQPLKSAWLKASTGFGRDAVGQGLNLLNRYGLARYDRSIKAWRLTPEGQQYLPRPAGCIRGRPASCSRKNRIQVWKKRLCSLKTRIQIPA